MIKPGTLAIISPVAVGFLLRILGYYTGQPLLGAKVVAAMLMFATVSGIHMALFLNTAGGAWDNAKKYIETGALGGKGSDTHKTAITGDTVGDPFKDTAGPSIHVLIKMLATITLVMAPIFLSKLFATLEVGDNVSKCAAQGADLFESIAAEIISAMILGGTMAQPRRIENPSGSILFPLVVHSFDLVISSIGTLSIRGKRDSSMKTPIEDPMAILQKGYSVTIVLSLLTFGASTRWLLYTEQAPSAWLNFALCGLVGIITAYAFVWITKSQLGLESTALPVLVISVSIVSAYWLGQTSGLVDESGIPTGGLFGTAVATMRMLSTAAYVLTMDMFGPIADDAGGIVEMSQQPESVREITDVLDAVGNTTKATTKGFAIGSAALASFLPFSACMDEVATFAQEPSKQVDIAIPEVFVGGLLGSMLIFLFSAWACAAVGKTAQEVVNEARRQFIERPGIMEYKEKPDYGRCVAIVASASLREMIKPGALAIISPVAVGFLFRILGYYTGQPLLGAKVVAAMLMFATVSGILMAAMLIMEMLVPSHYYTESFIQTSGPIGFLFRNLDFYNGHPPLGDKVVATLLMFALILLASSPSQIWFWSFICCPVLRRACPKSRARDDPSIFKATVVTEQMGADSQQAHDVSYTETTLQDTTTLSHT
ncbi:hypothetical protein LWI28_026920 [Acer negundo]|uniref:H(+)-exporting diphosphatase n=1 Tax=Acer negundo TaxID=4023 RepID=A0AAD5NJ47_ACENE|nr:hypothetical protein LWI28_026920 [Acer negundo]